MLGQREVHVWSLDLDGDRASEGDASGILSAEEMVRAGKFRSDLDRTRFISSRIALRTILSQYLGVDPGVLSFALGSHGKPRLAGVHQAKLSFNLSHSGGMALLAVARDETRSVGVDVELIRETRDLDGIAERFFSPSEAASLKRLGTADRAPGFYQLWTCKEAFLKATGEGIAGGLDQAVFRLSENSSTWQRLMLTSEQELGEWTIQQLHPAIGYAAAVVANGVGLQITTLHWRG